TTLPLTRSRDDPAHAQGLRRRYDDLCRRQRLLRHPDGGEDRPNDGRLQARLSGRARPVRLPRGNEAGRRRVEDPDCARRAGEQPAQLPLDHRERGGARHQYKGEDDTLPVASETSSLKSENGMMKIPAGPGLGITFDPEFISKATVVSL